MTRTRRIGLACLLMCCGVSVLWGFFLQYNSPDGMLDFKGVYYGARCLLHHSDPYKEGEPLRVCQLEGGDCSRPSDVLRQVLSLNVYFPTVFIFIAPFALLPWGPVHLLWMVLSAGILCLAAFLIWDLARNYSSVVAIFLICFVLANCEALFATGNAAGVAVGLCVLAVWCLLQERYAAVGILCLAFSLAIKPHDAGLVWLFFLLAGGVYRKRALQTLVVTVLLSLPVILWVSHVAPNWMGELHSNLLTQSAPGGAANPGPSSSNSGSGPSMIINLQSAIYVFRDDPRIYNPASYLVCGALMLVWSVCTLRSQFSQRRTWLALAAVVPLTMLVTYHRPYDAKLLLLAVPACAMLWAESGLIGWLALLVTTAGIVSTGDIPLTILIILNSNLYISTAGLYGKILTAVLLRPTPLILLAMGVFYLWVYLRRTISDIHRGSKKETTLLFHIQAAQNPSGNK
ncbi:MAG TPA: glycosyltransferase family 87 protein [Terracidiphilus sp.]|nr:glycosyltransferase family 87 protein [Terracidiphilus sp.]